MYQLIKDDPKGKLKKEISSSKWATLNMKQRMMYIETSKLNRTPVPVREVANSGRV